MYRMNFLKKKFNPVKKLITPDSYNKIIGNIWIGDKKSAFNEKFLKDKNIKLIINVTKVVDFIDNDDVIKYRIPIMDEKKKEYHDIMINHFNEVYDLIEEYASNNKGILIHCVSGSQRSPTLLALYLMKKNRITSKKAKKIIRKKRKIAFFLCRNFQPVLNYFDKNLDH